MGPRLWPSACPEGIWAALFNLVPWENIESAEKLRFFFRPHLFVRLKKRPSFISMRWVLVPFFGSNSKRLAEEIEKHAPPDSPLRAAITAPIQRWGMFRKPQLVAMFAPLFILPLVPPVLFITSLNHWRDKFWESDIGKDAPGVLRVYLEDRKELEQYPIFILGSAGKSDANEFFKGKIPAFENDAFTTTALSIPTEVEAEMRKHDGDWVDRWSPPFKKWKIDFEWLANLKKFDHWNIDREIAPKSVESIRRWDSTHAGISVLRDWARLRLVKGRIDNNSKAAFLEVEHLGRLLWTTDDQDGIATAVSILNSLRQFAVAQKLQLTTVPQATLDKANRYFRSQGTFWDPRVPSEVLSQVTNTRMGRCSLAQEAIKAALPVRGFMPDDFPEFLKAAHDYIAQTAEECKGGYWRRIWNDPSYSYADDYYRNYLSIEPEKKSGLYSLLERSKWMRSRQGYLALTNYYSFGDYCAIPGACVKLSEKTIPPCEI